MKSTKQSFPPLIGGDPQILILGTMPGDESIRLQEYYGHPRNRFWRVIASIFNCTIPLRYEDKKTMLINNGVALWDVAYNAVRDGSMDSTIQDETPNKIDQLLSKYPSVKVIVFNGQKAEKLYKRHFRFFPNIKYILCPSTSPANAQWNLDLLCKVWSCIVEK